ncbi:MAG TPA: hypothetical protein VFP78_02180 [Solirubrobacteraceae bacterium]|nr:hypothetical protein [Solirubrobacteraceae bacterium]
MSRIGFIVLAVCALAAFGLHKRQAVAAGGGAVSAEQRAATLRFAPGVTPQDREWILAAVGSARPEARRLIDEIDGLVEVRTDLRHDQAIGMAEMHGDNATVSLDARLLNGERAVDRGAAVLHELGHVIDFVLVDDEIRQRMDGAIPKLGTLAVEERFAETFAKWALNGRVSIAGDGYGIPNPPSIEDWGAPLAQLAIELDLER